jgi:hypothetical protein
VKTRLIAAYRLQLKTGDAVKLRPHLLELVHLQIKNRLHTRSGAHTAKNRTLTTYQSFVFLAFLRIPDFSGLVSRVCFSSSAPGLIGSHSLYALKVHEKTAGPALFPVQKFRKNFRISVTVPHGFFGGSLHSGRRIPRGYRKI